MITTTYLAIADILMCIGIFTSWLPYVKGVPEKEDYPAGWHMHTKSIFWPDMLLAIMLLTAGLLLFSGVREGIELSLMAGGMLLFLSLMVVAYNYQNNFYGGEHGGWGQIVEDVLLVAATCFITVSACLLS